MHVEKVRARDCEACLRLALGSTAKLGEANSDTGCNRGWISDGQPGCSDRCWCFESGIERRVDAVDSNTCDAPPKLLDRGLGILSSRFVKVRV